MYCLTGTACKFTPRKKRKYAQLKADSDFRFLKITFAACHDSCLRFVRAVYLKKTKQNNTTQVMMDRTSVRCGPFFKTHPIIMQKFENIHTLHDVILIVNGCWNKKTLKRVPTTHIKETALFSLLSRKPLVIVFAFLITTFAVDEEMESPSD